MNTNNATQTVSTLIDSFPPEDKSIMTNMISESLRGVISQQLIPGKDQSGMVPAYEVLLMTTPMANLIRDEKSEQLSNAMVTGKQSGMVVLDDSLMELVKSGTISGKDAYLHATNPSLFKEYL
jgi:twitching motility protein PilT